MIKIIESLRNLRKKATSALPQVQFFGYEKNYGAMPNQDFNRMVANYKSWAYACAQKNGFSVAKCECKLYKKIKKDGQVELEAVTQHPFLDLLKNVNPHSNKFEMLALTVIFLELTGNSYWWIPQNGLGIVNIWNLPAHWMKIVPDKQEFIAGYIMQVPGLGKPIPFDSSEIVHFKYPSPFNLFYGTGNLLAAAYSVDLNNSIKEWGINFFQNNAQPSGILSTESPMSDEGYKRFRDEWNRRHRGTKNAGKIALLDSKLQYHKIGSTLADAKFEGINKEIRDEILALFGVPASKLGLVEDVNRANAEANDYTYQKETILPKLMLLEEKINEKIMPMYDPNLVFKFDNPVPEDKEYRLREKEANLRMGFSSIDEERQKEGLEPLNLPETVVPLIPFSSVPAGTPKPGLDDEENPDEEDDEENADEGKGFFQKSLDSKWQRFVLTVIPMENLMQRTMQRFFSQQHSDVMQNLNNYKSINKKVNKDVSAFILLNLNEENNKLETRTKPNVRNAYTGGLSLGMMDTGQTIDFSLYEPNIIRAVNQRVGFFAEKINRATAELLKAELNQAVEAGESIEDVARRVDKVFRHNHDFRSKRIAQTEVIGATNMGQMDAYKEAGMEGKRWITARDEKVRDSHMAAEGQIVGITDTFITGDGNHLNYPGDRSTDAPASDIINCRCTMTAVRKL